jgi:hypothetical protein
VHVREWELVAGKSGGIDLQFRSFRPAASAEDVSDRAVELGRWRPVEVKPWRCPTIID